MKWVTRERPKIDRIACPWLITHFIDKAPEFLYVPADKVLATAKETGAEPYDIPGVKFSHVGEKCSFDAFIAEYKLDAPGLDKLADIVRGADTSKLDLTPQSHGLFAISLGLSHVYADDHEMLKHGMVMYDALYAWCRHLVVETPRLAAQDVMSRHGLHDLTLTELSIELGSKRASSREIVDALLERIDKADGKLHAFTEVYAREARALADAADTARGSGFPLGPLHGLPIAYKDLCDIAGRIGTGGSQMLAKRVATETANTVERLTAAGMVPLGKLHMVEFALGGWGTNPLMGAPWNPWDLELQRVPGGSSSGTGVAVAARLSPAGIGSDTGGSVRIPAAFNGLVGLKVTFGRIGLSGTLLLSWTLDSMGPMARCVEDCSLLLNALAAPDPRDPTTLDQPLEDFTLATRGGSIAGLHLALPDPSQLPQFVQSDVVAAWQTAARVFENLGAHVESVRLPDWTFELGPPTGTIMASEAFALHRGHIEDMSQAIGPGVRGRALAARSFAPGAYAQEIRRMGERRRAFAEWFDAHDAILMPTVGVPAIPLSDVDEASAIPNHLTRPANYLGLCSLAMPAGFSTGLPIGVQIIGKPYAEGTILRLGKAHQDATDFHRQAPDLSTLGL